MDANVRVLKVIESRPSLFEYQQMFGHLAELHADIESRAHSMAHYLVDTGIDLSELNADGALLQLGLAQEILGAVGIESGLPQVSYVIDPNSEERERVKNALMSSCEGDCGDSE